jgi:hypothetical protein
MKFRTGGSKALQSHCNFIVVLKTTLCVIATSSTARVEFSNPCSTHAQLLYRLYKHNMTLYHLNYVFHACAVSL